MVVKRLKMAMPARIQRVFLKYHYATNHDCFAALRAPPHVQSQAPAKARACDQVSHADGTVPFFHLP
jgi:hypothetical protein